MSTTDHQTVTTAPGATARWDTRYEGALMDTFGTPQLVLVS